MKYLRSRVAMAVLAVMVVSITAPAWSAPTATSVWQKVQHQIRSTKNYTLQYDYTGPKGQFIFDYSVVRPNMVKTKILKGENEGATLIYNPDEFGNQVRARKGWLGKGINLDDPKVAGTPVIQPVFDMLMEKTRNATNVALSGESTVKGTPVYVLTMTDASGQQHTISVDKTNYWVLQWKYTDGQGTQDRTFYNIKPNSNPRIDF